MIPKMVVVLQFNKELDISPVLNDAEVSFKPAGQGYQIIMIITQQNKYLFCS